MKAGLPALLHEPKSEGSDDQSRRHQAGRAGPRGAVSEIGGGHSELDSAAPAAVVASVSRIALDGLEPA